MMYKMASCVTLDVDYYAAQGYNTTLKSEIVNIQRYWWAFSSCDTGCACGYKIWVWVKS